MRKQSDFDGLNDENIEYPACVLKANWQTTINREN